jgi:hypothetical protein
MFLCHYDAKHPYQTETNLVQFGREAFWFDRLVGVGSGGGGCLEWASCTSSIPEMPTWVRPLSGPGGIVAAADHRIEALLIEIENKVLKEASLSTPVHVRDSEHEDHQGLPGFWGRVTVPSFKLISKS